VSQPRPLILDDATVSIDSVQLECSSTHVELSPDVSVVSIDTICGSVDYPGTVKWSLVLTLVQSFEAGSVEETLSAAVDGGVPVAFEIIPFGSEAVSATNPSYSGMVVPKPYSPINADAGSESTIDLEWSLTAPPTKSVVPLPLATSAAAAPAKA